MDLNCISSLNFNKNIVLKSPKQSACYSTNSIKSNDFKAAVYPKNYYLNQISFGAKKLSADELIAKIGEENFPSPEIVNRLREIDYSKNFSLYDVHMDYYKDLLECSTLEEAKELYPEFKDVIDAKDIDINLLNTRDSLYKISTGKIKDIDIDNLSLELLKRIYGKVLPISNKEEYWNLAYKALTGLAKSLNIKILNKWYANRISFASDKGKKNRSNAANKQWQNPNSKINSKECKEKISKSTQKQWGNQEYRELMTQGITKRWQDPDSKLNSKECREKMSQGAKKEMKSPEARVRLSQAVEKLRQDSEFIEKMDLVYKARSLAHENHPEIKAMMQEVAKSFPRIGEIISKKRKGIELTQDEKKYQVAYYKLCEKIMPGYQQIIGDEQHNILVEWGIVEE